MTDNVALVSMLRVLATLHSQSIFPPHRFSDSPDPGVGACGASIQVLFFVLASCSC